MFCPVTGVMMVSRQTKVDSLRHTPPTLEAIAVTQRIQPATIHLQIPRNMYRQSGTPPTLSACMHSPLRNYSATTQNYTSRSCPPVAVSCYLQPRAMNGIKTLPSVTKSWLAERGGACRPNHPITTSLVSWHVRFDLIFLLSPCLPRTASMHPTAPAVRSAARCRRRG